MALCDKYTTANSGGGGNICALTGMLQAGSKKRMPSKRTIKCRLVPLAAATIVAVTITVLPQPSQAQFVCGLSATGADPQTGQGATATGPNSMACGIAGGGGTSATGSRSIAIGYGDAFGTHASGTGAIAIGSEAFASGTGGVAIGEGTSAGTAANNLAVGSGAFINPTYDSTTVLGADSLVNGSNTVSVGAQAGTNSISNNAVAVGQNARVLGDNTTAVGQGTSAGFAGSAAFGQGATTTRANQQAFGTASNTYTMAGITSAASAAAQTGPTQLVTSDASGNLATMSPAALGLASASEITAINARLDDLAGRSSKAFAGVAMAFALAGAPTALPHETFVATINWGTFQGAHGFAVSGAYRVGHNVQLNGGVAFSPDQNVAGGRAGVRLGW